MIIIIIIIINSNKNNNNNNNDTLKRIEIISSYYIPYIWTVSLQLFNSYFLPIKLIKNNIKY